MLIVGGPFIACQWKATGTDLADWREIALPKRTKQPDVLGGFLLGLARRRLLFARSRGSPLQPGASRRGLGRLPGRALRARGCHNINLVIPEHVVPQILEGLLIAV